MLKEMFRFFVYLWSRPVDNQSVTVHTKDNDVQLITDEQAVVTINIGNKDFAAIFKKDGKEIFRLWITPETEGSKTYKIIVEETDEYCVTK